MGSVGAQDGLESAGGSLAYRDDPMHYLAVDHWQDKAHGPPPCVEDHLASTEDQPPQASYLHLLCQHEGQGHLVQGAWRVALNRGDVALYLTHDVATETPAAQKQVAMIFPLQAVSECRRDVAQLLPVVLPGALPTTHLIRYTADCLHGVLAGLAPPLQAMLLDNWLASLAGILVFHGHGAPMDAPKLARYHLHRIKAFLRLHLRKADLAVKDVAQALGLSISHIHRLFTHEGCSISDWLWRERLEACAADLSNPAEAHRSVGEIALTWGFNNISHFSRAFKKHYGVTARSWRARAPWRGPL